MVKWYHKSLPSLRCGFDSRYPLQNSPHHRARRFSSCFFIPYASRIGGCFAVFADMKKRRHQGGGGCRRSQHTRGAKGGGEAPGVTEPGWCRYDLRPVTSGRRRMPPVFAPSSRREEESVRCICFRPEAGGLETGDTREEEGAAGLLTTPEQREEEALVYLSSGQGRYYVRRHQGGGRCRR